MLIFNSFGFNRLPFFKHLLFQLMTTRGSSSYYINWYIISFRQFRCCYDNRTNKFSSKHVMYFNLFRASCKSMFCTIIDYTGIMNMYFSWFHKLGLVLGTCFIDLTIATGATGTSFSCYDRSLLNDRFYHNWYRLMLI